MVKKEVYIVEGMTCAGCERTVQKVLGNLKGIESAKATLDQATVEIEYDPAQVTVDEMKNTLGKVGYEIMDIRPAHGQREGSDEAVS